MTTAEDLKDFQPNFHMDRSGDSDTPIFESTPAPNNNSAESISIVSDMVEDKRSVDSKLSEVPQSSVEEKLPENLEHSNLNEISNAGTSKTDDDEWLDIMGSGNFKKKIIKAGLGFETRPNRGDQVTVDVSYYANNILFEEKKDLRFIVGDLDVIQGVDLVVCLMEKGEQARVKIPSKLAYGPIGLLPDVPPDSEIECDIELKEVVSIDENSLNVSERLQLGNEKRCRGNFFYERAQYIDAIHCYERAVEYLDGVRDGSDSSPEELQEIVNMRIIIYNNMAQSHLKLSAYSAALRSVENVLKVQPKNVKALYRKGKILGMQGSTDEAIACMKAAANIEPETKLFQSELTKLKNQKKKEEHTQKVMYQRMFKSESKKPSKAASWVQKWSMIGCGVLVAIGSVVAYRQYHV